MIRPAAWQPKKTPFRLTAMILSRSSSGSSMNGPPSMMPAMLHHTWMPPCWAATRWARASTSDFRDTSRATASAVPPAAPICSAVARAVSSWMSAHTTVAPAPASDRALDRAMPLPAPVTTATFPSTRNDWISVLASMACADLFVADAEGSSIPAGTTPTARDPMALTGSTTVHRAIREATVPPPGPQAPRAQSLRRFRPADQCRHRNGRTHRDDEVAATPRPFLPLPLRLTSTSTSTSASASASERA